MADVHECGVCGAQCDCDGEDTFNPQSDDCVHLAMPGECTGDEDVDVDSEPILESEDEIAIADSIRRGATY